MQNNQKNVNTLSVIPTATDDVFEGIPVDIRAVLEPHQIERLQSLLTTSRANHTIAYRVSTRIGSQGYYLSILCGLEKRSMQRLELEGQGRSLKGLLAKLTGASLLFSSLIVSATFIVPVLFYIITYVFGIELFPAD